MQAPLFETDRLVLRMIEPARDFEAFAAMMSDEATTQFTGGVQDRSAAWRSMCAYLGHWQVRGYGMLAIDEKASGLLVGRVGPWSPEGWPGPEIGWTIARERWGRGYASEAATAALDWAFGELGWTSVIHVIQPANAASIRVAEKLGSRRLGGVDRMPLFHFAADLYGQSATDWRARRVGTGG
jgi:RimJ/RimL family protein N-acetyltransferase